MKIKFKKWNAFTLIELLAVILILALLALIATPIISKVIKTSKQNAFGVTCKNIYKSVITYADLHSSSSCFVFDFEKNITTPEMMDGIEYQPLNKLNLSGSLPRKGQAKVCNGVIELFADDGENTCLVNEDTNNVLSGTLENIDITAPILESITLTSETSTVTAVANAKEEDGKIVKYYYSLDGKDYKESELNTYTFKKLKQKTEYKVYVRVENESGLLSEVKTGKVWTKEVPRPVLSLLSQTPAIEEGYDYAVEKVIRIKYGTEGTGGPGYYFKSNVAVKIDEIENVLVCGNEVLPGECNTEMNTTIISSNTWYKTQEKIVDISYGVEGVLYALIGDGTNTSGIVTYSITDIDTTKPDVSLIVNDIRTDRATLNATCSDGISGITKYEFSKDNGLTWVDKGTTNRYTYTGLTSGTEYTFAVRCTNGSGLKEQKLQEILTGEPITPIFTNTSNTPSSGYEYYISRTIRIKYVSTNVVNPEYYLKSNVAVIVDGGMIVESCGIGIIPSNCVTSNVTILVAGTWYRTTSTTPSIEYINNGTLYAAVGDGTNLSTIATYSVSDIDVTEPTCNISLSDIKTDRVTVTASGADSESGITKYEFSKDNGTTWIDKGIENSNVFTGLTSGEEYTFKVRCTNGSSLTKTAEDKISPETPRVPIFENTSNIPDSGYNYYTSRTYKITYNNSNIESPEYYFKSTVDSKSSVGVYACTDTKASACSNAITTTLVAGTWYKTNSTTPSVTYTSNGTIYAAASDGTNLSTTATYGVTDIDVTEPICNISLSNIKTDRVTVTASGSDNESGIVKYEVSKDNGATWVNKGTTTTHTFTGLSKDTSYTFKVRCTNGSSLTNESSSVYSTLGITNPSFTEVDKTITSGYTWATKRVIKITYNASNIQTPEYYFKSTVAATSSVGVYACTDTKATACSNTSTTTLVAGTWYKTTSLTPNITYTANGTLYALTSDGTNTSGTSTRVITETSDGTPSTPVITGGNANWTTTSRTISVSTASTETSGIYRYQYYVSTSSSGQTGGSWTTLGSNVTSVTLTNSGTNYIYFRAIANNGKVSGVSNSQTTKVDTTSPTITINKTVSNNQNVLTATISPSSAVSGYTYKWYKDGSATSSTGTSYTTSSAGTYKIVVTTGSGISKEVSKTISSYTVSYNMNGGSGTIANQTKVEDLTLTLTSSVPTRSGYEFLGWSTSSTATTATYASGGNYTSNASATLYAVWKVAYTCPNGGILTQNTSYSSATNGWICVTNATASSCNGYNYSCNYYDVDEYTTYTCDDGDELSGSTCYYTEYSYSSAEWICEEGDELASDLLCHHENPNAGNGSYDSYESWVGCSDPNATPIGSDCGGINTIGDCQCELAEEKSYSATPDTTYSWSYDHNYCSDSDDTISDDYDNGYDVDCTSVSYSCPSNFSYYSGTGSSKKCYQAATN